MIVRERDEEKRRDPLTVISQLRGRGRVLQGERKGEIRLLERRIELLRVLEGETDKLVLSSVLIRTSCISSSHTHSLKYLPMHSMVDH